MANKVSKDSNSTSTFNLIKAKHNNHFIYIKILQTLYTTISRGTHIHMSVGFKPGVKEYGKGDIDDESAESTEEDDVIVQAYTLS